MNIRFLETFVWLARLQSFRLTAEKLKTTQASVSSRIASLETHFNARLFFRTSRSASLTPAGTKLLAMAERVVHLGEELQRELDGVHPDNGLIRIGVVDWAVHSWFPAVMVAIKDRFPGLQAEVVLGGTRQLLEMLTQDELDVAVRLDGVVRPEGEQHMSLGELPMGWIASPALVLPERLLEIEDLAMQPIIGFSRHTSPNVALERTIAARQDLPWRMQSVASVALMIQMVVDGLGVAAVPQAAVSRELGTGLIKLLEVGTPPDPLVFEVSIRPQDADSVVMRVVSLVREVAEMSLVPLSSVRATPDTITAA